MGKTSQGQGKRARAVVWVPDREYVRPLQVRAGLSDGATTEVEGKDLAEGMMVVTGVQTGSVGQAGVRNPFTPRFRASRSRKSK